MEIKVKKLTDASLMQKAISFTMFSKKESKMTLDSIYRTEHSPIRTQLFWVEMYDIPTFVSVHLVRHNIGVNHFVSTRRDDRGSDGVVTRLTPVNHSMLVNAQALIGISRKRLCTKSHKETRKVMELIKKEVAKVDPDLARYMVEECKYRGGICPEQKSCGKCEEIV